jgi:hypothetical protein
VSLHCINRNVIKQQDRPDPVTSEAIAHYRNLAPDRDTHIAEVKEHTAKSPRKAAVVARIEQYWREGDFWSDMVRRRGAPIVDWLVHHSNLALQRDPRAIVFGSVFERDSFATVNAFPDGSGLVLVSDPLAAMLLYGAKLALLWLRPGDVRFSSARRIAGTLRVALLSGTHRVEHHDQTQLAVALLRYLFVSSRTLGSPRRLLMQLGDRHERFPSLLAELAMYFVVGHEVAHFVLGHDTQDLTTQTAEDLEFAADEMAYRIVRGLDLIPWDDQWLAHAIRLAFMQVEASETALMIRRSTTHPRAKDRLDRLASVTGNPWLLTPSLLLAGLEYALPRACAVTSPIPDTWWDLPARDQSAMLESDDLKHYELARLLDRWQGRSDEEHLKALDQAHKEGTVDLATCVRQTRQESPVAALTALGMTEPTVTAACDQSRGLSFYFLVRAIESTKAYAEHVGASERLLLTLSTASLLEPFLQ